MVILRILKWLAGILVLLFLCASLILYSLVNSKKLRQNIFPLTYQYASLNIVCQDLVISSADTMHLMGLDVTGRAFSLQIPDLEIKYSMFPMRLYGFSASHPDMRIVLKKGGQKAGFPDRTVRKILGMLRVQHGDLLVSWDNGRLKITDVSLIPATSAAGRDAAGPAGLLTRGTCSFHAIFGEQDITGTARIGMKQANGLIYIESPDVRAILTGHPPISLAASVETGLMPGQLGIFKGTVEVRDTIAILPPAMRSTAYLKDRLKRVDPVPARANVMLDFKKGAKLKGQVHIPPWFFPERFKPSSPLPADWTLEIDHTFLNGHFSADIPAISTALQGKFNVTQNQTVNWNVSVKTRVTNYSIYIDDNHAAEAVNGRIELVLRGSAAPHARHGGDFFWHALVSWKSGDVLIYPWYFDLANLKGNINASGSAGEDILRIKKANITGPASISIKNITVNPQAFIRAMKADPIKTIRRLTEGAGRITVDAPLDELYQLLIREPFQAGHPALRALKPYGEIALDIGSLGTGIQLNCNMDWNGKTIVSGLRLDALIPPAGRACNAASLSWDRILIPMPAKGLLKIGTKADGKIGGKPASGMVSKAAAIPDTFYLDRGSLPLSACDKTIAFGPVTIPAESGTVRIARGEVEYATGHAVLKGVSLDDIKLVWNINGEHVKAVVAGKDLTVKFKKGIIKVDGTVTTLVAEGRLEKSNIWVDLSGPVPRYGADIKFYGIDLATLTSLTGFGRITGRLDGHIRHLVISGNQPESFELEIRSRKTSGVDQEISIKAIRSLSILGGGGGGIPLLGEFFKNFSYSKIAVSCSLKNDIFTMHGLIKKNGTEYLVERGFWGGVNVINQNPGGRIAFSDMLERLARISKSGKAEVN